jgi:hypothetical protein
MPDKANRMVLAVQAAQDGQHSTARKLFLQVLEEDPNNREAWERLSDLLEDPEDCLTALENALALCQPGTIAYIQLQERRKNHLEKYPQLTIHKVVEPQQREQIEKTFHQVLRLSTSGKQAEATALLMEILDANPEDERALLVYSEVHPDLKEKVWALGKVVALNPCNEEGWRRLELLRQVEKEPLKRGKFLEERGEFDQAIEIYRSVIVHSRSALERLEAEQRIGRIHLHQEAHRIQPVHPNLNVIRLTVGPLLLFVVMVFMQSGLNVLHTPAAALLGAVSVTVGSLLVTVIGMRPAPPKWVEIIGQPGTGDEPEFRAGLRELGWALLLAPFTIFMIEAGYRLGVLQASILANVR